MSDVSQGPGWWQASDGKWYPPEQAPAAPTAPPTGPPPGYAPPGYGAPAASPYGGAPAGGPPTGQLVSWGTRVGAYLVDFLIVVAGYVVLFILAAILGAIADALAAIVLLVGYLALLAYQIYIWFLTGETGQSPGKKIIGIQVVSEETGRPIGGGSGVARGFAHILDGICMIGYLFPLWDPKKQTFADKIMKTVVIPGPKQSFGPELFKK